MELKKKECKTNTVINWLSGLFHRADVSSAYYPTFLGLYNPNILLKNNQKYFSKIINASENMFRLFMSKTKKWSNTRKISKKAEDQKERAAYAWLNLSLLLKN